MHKAVLLTALLATACNPAEERSEAPIVRESARPDFAKIAKANAIASIPELAPGEVFFQASGCFGACPVFSFVIASDGSGVFNGRKHVESAGEHGFVVTPDHFTAFNSRIERFRPDGLLDRSAQSCPQPVPTDGAAMRLAWPDGDILVLYDACGTDEMPDAWIELSNAWQELPAIVELVGEGG
ncbi:DUF6438 domain-containing protein [Erythrobacter sp.]|uniref:DUF6438 domain-containing protein n=1 Tax=Erythrobacter sp. TaxID=1042 RepID=UPI0025E00CF6|nr:DUF6438 domain-containing protein [Erythrobacter sp.]